MEDSAFCDDGDGCDDPPCSWPGPSPDDDDDEEEGGSPTGPGPGPGPRPVPGPGPPPSKNRSPESGPSTVLPGYSGPLGCPADDDGGRDDGSTHGDPIHVPTGDVLLESEGYDAIGLSPLSTIRLARHYSSKRAIRDTMAYLGESSVSPIRSAALSLPQTGFSPGWYHRFDYWLLADVTPSGVTAPETLLFFRNRTNDRFATSGPGLYGDTFYYVETDGSHHVVLANDTDLKFEAVTPGSSIHRLAQMLFTDGRFRTFRYYGSTESSPCASTASHEVGKLCQIEDSDGAWIHFAGYSSVHGYVTSIESQGTLSAPRHRVTYEYTTDDVEGVNEDATTFVTPGWTPLRSLRFDSSPMTAQASSKPMAVATNTRASLTTVPISPRKQTPTKMRTGLL